MLVTPTGTTKVPSVPTVENVHVTVVPASAQAEGNAALADAAPNSTARTVGTKTTPIRADLIICALLRLGPLGRSLFQHGVWATALVAKL